MILQTHESQRDFETKEVFERFVFDNRDFGKNDGPQLIRTKHINVTLHGNEAASGFVGYALISKKKEALSSNRQIRFILN